MTTTNKRLYFDEGALNRLERGIDDIVDTVKVTLGPSGRNVLLDKSFGTATITKDGVSVAREVEFGDVRSMGCDIAREAAIKTAERAGDGTTTTLVLMQALFKAAKKGVSAGMHPIFVKKGMDFALKEALRFLEETSISVTTQEEIAHIATLSSNGDTELGTLIAGAVEMAGKGGVIGVEESGGLASTLEYKDGLRLDRGYDHPDWLSTGGGVPPTKFTVGLTNPLVLLSDFTLSHPEDVLPALEVAVAQSRPLLCVSHGIEGHAKQILLTNHAQGVVQVCTVTVPRIREKRTCLLENLAALGGGIVMTRETGTEISKLEDPKTALGTFETVTVAKDHTIFSGGPATTEVLQARIKVLENLEASVGSEHDMEFYRKQVSQMGGGIAMIRVGAPTEIELKELKGRVEDALGATQSAIQGGYVAGSGGYFLLIAHYLQHVLDDYQAGDTSVSPDEVFGFKTFLEALEAPMTQIFTNAGLNPHKALVLLSQKVEEANGNYAVDARTGDLVLAVEAGIIDPSLVLSQALINAVSTASMALTVSCMISFTSTEDLVSGQGLV